MIAISSNGLPRSRGVDRLAAAAFRRLHQWLLPDVVTVLCYHGLVDRRLPVPDYCFLPLEKFVLHMQYLARHFTVLHLEEALAPGRPRMERPVACVTFDDGFGSVHDLAFPVLERLCIPATVFLVTDRVDTDTTVWFARLHQAICETTASEVSLGDQRFPLNDPLERAAASAGLQRMLKPLERTQFAETLEAVLGRLEAPGRRTEAPCAPMRMLRRGEIRRMSGGGLVRFGSHTASHQILSRTTPEDAWREVERSVAAIAALVERPSRVFSYPNGGPDDFDAGTIAAVKRAGLMYAVTMIEQPNPPNVDPYRVRRYGAGDDDHLSSFAAYPLVRFARRVHHVRAVRALIAGGSSRT